MIELIKITYKTTKTLVLWLIIYPVSALFLSFRTKKELTTGRILIIIASCALILFLWFNIPNGWTEYFPEPIWEIYKLGILYPMATIIAFTFLLIGRLLYMTHLKIDTQYQQWKQNIRQPDQETQRIQRQKQIQQPTTED